MNETKFAPELTDLEVWRQAYNAAIVGLGRQASTDIVKQVADNALEQYCKKRAELEYKEATKPEPTRIR